MPYTYGTRAGMAKKKIRVTYAVTADDVRRASFRVKPAASSSFSLQRTRVGRCARLCMCMCVERERCACVWAGVLACKGVCLESDVYV